MNLLRRIALAGALSTAAASAYAECKPNLVAQIPVTIENNRAYIEGVQIDGQPVKAVLDSGSTNSFLMRAEAERLGVPLKEAKGYHFFGVGGEAVASVAVVKHFQMGATFVGDQLDLLVIGNRGDDRFAPLVIGDDFLSHFVTEFDFANGIVRLFKPAGCQPAQMMYWSKTYSLMALERLSAADPKMRVEVQVNGKAVMAELDTGADLSMIERSVAEGAGVMKADTNSTQAISGVAGKKAESWLGYFATLAIGDEVLKNAKVWVGDYFAPDQMNETGSRIGYVPENVPRMLIGCDFFVAHHLIVFPQERQALFTYNGGPALQSVRSVAAWSKDARPDSAASAASGSH